MTTTAHEETRIKQRFAVNLKALGALAGHEAEEQQFSLSNLSATGARLHFETKKPVTKGMRISLKIFIPSTVLHIQNSAEIMWVTRQHNAVSIGVKFADVLSESMMQQLVKTR